MQTWYAEAGLALTQFFSRRKYFPQSFFYPRVCFKLFSMALDLNMLVSVTTYSYACKCRRTGASISPHSASALASSDATLMATCIHGHLGLTTSLGDIIVAGFFLLISYRSSCITCNATLNSSEMGQVRPEMLKRTCIYFRPPFACRFRNEER